MINWLRRTCRVIVAVDENGFMPHCPCIKSCGGGEVGGRGSEIVSPFCCSLHGENSTSRLQKDIMRRSDFSSTAFSLHFVGIFAHYPVCCMDLDLPPLF